MRITMISDVKGNAESIISYGLNLAKYLEAEVDLVHVIDSRVVQGVSSMYADSQSATPGNKLSHAEILQREKQQIAVKIDQVLSKEASRLNYPLKVNVNIEKNSIENKIAGDLNVNSTSLLVVNKEADGSVFESQSEIVDCCKDYKGMSLLVPPGEEFQPYSSVLLPTDFSHGEFDAYRGVADFLEAFYPVINAVGVGNGKDEEELKRWDEDLANIFKDSSINHKVLSKGDFEKEFIDFVEMVEPAATLIFQRPKNFISSMFKKEFLKKVLEQTHVPVLFYSMKQ